MRLTRLWSCKTCFRSYQLKSKLRQRLTRLSLMVDSIHFRLVSIIRPTKSNHIKCDVINIIERHRFISGVFQLKISKIMPVKTQGCGVKTTIAANKVKYLKNLKFYIYIELKLCMFS